MSSSSAASTFTGRYCRVTASAAARRCASGTLQGDRSCRAVDAERGRPEGVERPGGDHRRWLRWQSDVQHTCNTRTESMQQRTAHKRSAQHTNARPHARPHVHNSTHTPHRQFTHTHKQPQMPMWERLQNGGWPCSEMITWWSLHADQSAAGVCVHALAAGEARVHMWCVSRDAPASAAFQQLRSPGAGAFAGVAPAVRVSSEDVQAAIRN